MTNRWDPYVYARIDPLVYVLSTVDDLGIPVLAAAIDYRKHERDRLQREIDALARILDERSARMLREA